MTIRIFYNNKPYYQTDLFKNVQYITFEYQKHNGIHGSYWLMIHFKNGSPEFKEYNKGEVAIGIEPKKTEWIIMDK